MDIDFRTLKPNVKYDEKWKSLMNRLHIILPDRIKNQRVKEKFAVFSEMTYAAKVVTLLFGLHADLYTRAHSSKSQPGKINRDTIEDGFNKIITLANNYASISLHIAELTSKTLNEKNTLQPFILCIGSDIEKVQSDAFYLVFDDRKYKFANIDTAVEMLLKLYIVFNLQYPPAIKNLLDLLSFYLLDQKSDLNYKSKTILNLIENSEK